MTDELIPDNPHLKQIDTLFRQMAYSRVTPTENDIRCADLLADTLRLWAGIAIIPLEELEAMPEAPPVSRTPNTSWAERADIAKRDASLRRN
jgi:hypothetical protein